MKVWSKKWKSSKNPKKQRKYVYNAPLHVRRKFLSAHLSKELREKYKKRSFPVRKGDEVQIMKGKFKKKSGKISRVDTRKIKVYIDRITRKKVDGTDIQVPIHPSNLRIVNLNLEDKKRIKALSYTVKKEEKHVETPKKAVSSKVLENISKEKKMDSDTKTRSS